MGVGKDPTIVAASMVPFPVSVGDPSGSNPRFPDGGRYADAVGIASDVDMVGFAIAKVHPFGLVAARIVGGVGVVAIPPLPANIVDEPALPSSPRFVGEWRFSAHPAVRVLNEVSPSSSLSRSMAPLRRS